MVPSGEPEAVLKVAPQPARRPFNKKLNQKKLNKKQCMTPATPDLPAVETQIVEMTNAYRAQNNLNAVTRNPLLARAARAYARYLARNDAFSHDADGRKPAERVAAAGYDYCQVGENLALALDSRGFKSGDLSSQAMDGWINSPGHRQNLLAPHVTHIGVAVVQAPAAHPKFISVQLFARPQSAQYAFQVSNASPATVKYDFAGELHDLKPGYAARHRACFPEKLEFRSATFQPKNKVRKLKARYQASDGKVYIVRADGGSRVAISVEQQQSLSRITRPAGSRTLVSGSGSTLRTLPLPARNPLR